jgi:multicomponent K+:H+ antiporter subunit F
MLTIAIWLAVAMLAAALLLNLSRLLRGPDVLDRVVALDTAYVNSVGLIILLGVGLDSQAYFEAAVLIALMGFVGTVALAKFVLRGDVIE